MGETNAFFDEFFRHFFPPLSVRVRSQPLKWRGIGLGLPSGTEGASLVCAGLPEINKKNEVFSQLFVIGRWRQRKPISWLVQKMKNAYSFIASFNRKCRR